jgi:hypothetical protein
MYQFNMSSTDQQELTIVAVLRATGLELFPSFKHNVGILLGATPQRGGGLMRAFASLAGYDQRRITEEVRTNALPRIQENVEKEAMEQALENTTAQSSQRNATFRRYLIGYQRLAFDRFLIEGLSLRSRPENALIGGLLKYLGAENQRGADAPQPPSFARPERGVSADLHLTSILGNLARGYLQSPEARGVETLLVETRAVPSGSAPADALQVTRNADFAAFLKAVESAKAANDPKVQAFRIKRPSAPPDFGADSKGNLVVIVRDLHVEVPAPAPQPGRVALPGPGAKVYRITSPSAEVSLSFRVEPTVPGGPLRFKGKVESLDLGSNGKIVALNDDPAKGQQVNRLLANVVIGLVRARVQGQAIDLPLDRLPLQGFAIQRVSPLDPSGWIRANLVRTGTPPMAIATSRP